MSELEESRETRFGKHRAGCMCRFCDKVRQQLIGANEKEAQGLRVRRRLKKEKPSDLTARQQRFVQEFSDPASPAFRNAAESARLSGYSPDAAPNIGTELLRNERVQRSIVGAMERAGITSDYRAQKLREGLEAVETWRHATRDGEVLERRSPDYYARQKHLELAMRAAGDFPKEDSVVQAALILKIPEKPMSVDDWNRLVDGGQLCKSASPPEK